MAILLLFLLSLPILLLLALQKSRGKRNLNLPPGPPGLPIVGNLFQIDNSAPHEYLWHLSKKYGPLLSLRLGAVQTLVVSSSSMAREVMKTQDLNYASRPSLRGQQKLSYEGLDLIFAPYNDYWREMRKICVLQLFNSKRVQSFGSVREDEVNRMTEKISRLAKEGKAINLSETLLALTSSIICMTAFGKRYEEGEGHEKSRFHNLLNEAQAMMGIFFFTDFFPWIGWFDKISGLTKRLEKNFRELDTFYQEIIDDHLDPKRQKTGQDDITDVLLKMQRERLFTMDLTSDHIKAVLMDIFIAGTDTSAATLVWAMTALIKNPKVLSKAQEEIRNVIGKKGRVAEEDLPKLPYLKALVKETFRLFPPGPLLVPRETIQASKLGGFDIPARTLVHVNAWAIGRDPEVWENPEEFRPERFLGSSIDFKGLDFELIPFGAGRRGCPGLHMGAATVELALANLLSLFDWEFPAGVKKEDIDSEVIPGLTMHKKNALCLIAKSYYI